MKAFSRRTPGWARWGPLWALLGSGLFCPGAFAQKTVAAEERPAASFVPAGLLTAGGSAAVSPIDLVGALHVSLANPAPTGSSEAPPSLAAPALSAAAQAYGMSADNWSKLVRIVASAPSAKAALPVLSDADARGTLTALNRTLDDISPGKAPSPQDIEAVLNRLWNGRKESSSAVAAPAQNRADAPRLGFWRGARKILGLPPVSRHTPSAGRTDTQAYWDAHHDALLAKAQEFKTRLDDFAAKRALEIGPDQFQQELEKNKILIDEPGIAKVEMTTVDKHPFVRVVDRATELSFLFLDAGVVSPDSKHLRQIVARQFFDSGSDRTDGRRGRNPVIVWQKDGRTVEVQFHQKPAFPSREWWRQYWRATWKAPTWKSFRQGLFMGAVQGLLAWDIAWLNVVLAGAAISFAPIAFTIVFGTLVGAFISFYKNWTYRGSAFSQLLKSAMISALFAYPVMAFTHHLSWTLASNALIFLNIALNNWGKVAWQAIPKMFEKNQHFKALQPLFWDFRTGDMMNQGYYQINWTLRMIALLVPTWIGYIPMLVGIPVGMAVSFWYAKHHQYAEAAEMFKKPRLLLEKLRGLFRRSSR